MQKNRPDKCCKQVFVRPPGKLFLVTYCAYPDKLVKDEPCKQGCTCDLKTVRQRDKERYAQDYCLFQAYSAYKPA